MSHVDVTFALLVEPIMFVSDSSKRIFWLYILASIAIAAGALWFTAKQERTQLIGQLLRPSLWLNRSSWVDVQWMFINNLLRLGIIVPLLGGQLTMAWSVNTWLNKVFGNGNFFQLSHTGTALLFTACLFFFEDFARFILHWCYHKVPVLWRFHAIHHSATTLTPLTLYRVHAIEMCINSCRSLLIVGGISGLFIYLFDGSITRVEVLGASIFSFIFNMAGSNLRHSPIWIGYGWAERFFISPAQHQIHHSIHPSHIDKNFGSTLALWDRLFGSWIQSKEQSVHSFGIYDSKNDQSLSSQIWGIRSQS